MPLTTRTAAMCGRGQRLGRSGHALLRAFRTGLIALAMAALIPLSAAAQQEPGAAAAKQTVETLYDTLTATMKNADSLGYKGRYEKLEPVLRKTYDFPFMIRWIMGENWNKLDEDQRSQLTDAFARMSISTYADRFDSYSGEKFVIDQVQQGRRDTLLVKTRLVQSSGEPVKLDYLMHKTGDGWRIIDVFAKGTFSEIATRKSEYGSIYQRQGFDGLLSLLRKKIAAHS